jgi:GT2 family glycosyltransferase
MAHVFMPKITAVTVTYNAASVLHAFMDCVVAQVGIEWQLIIIDNNSTDETRDLLGRIDHPRIKIILNQDNTGVAAANNQGIVLAQQNGSDAMLLINNDTVFNTTLFSDLYQSLLSSKAAAVTPLIPFFDEPDKIWYGGGHFTVARGIISFHDSYRRSVSDIAKTVFAVEYAPTCCLLIRSTVFDQIGLMDEQYFVYWDDSDFCWRMHQAGLTLVCDPALRLLHKVSVSTGGAESNFSIRYQHRNHMLFLRKHHGLVARGFAIGVVMLKAAGWLLLRRTDMRRLRVQYAALREGLSMPLID